MSNQQNDEYYEAKAESKKWVAYNHRDELVRAMIEIKRLGDALDKIIEQAPANGEDVSYLIAKQAKAYT